MVIFKEAGGRKFLGHFKRHFKSHMSSESPKQSYKANKTKICNKTGSLKINKFVFQYVSAIADV